MNMPLVDPRFDSDADCERAQPVGIVVARTPSTCHRVIELLQNRGHATEVLDWETARSTISVRPSVLLAWLEGADEVDLIRQFRAADANKTTFVIGVLSVDASDDLISAAHSAGCHDVVRGCRSDAELCARVEILERLRGWRGLDAAPTAGPRVHEARTWHLLGKLVADDFEQMVGEPVAVVGDAALSTSVRCASIPMVFPRDHVELAISLLADATAYTWLGGKLLGDESLGPEDVADMLREMANVAGGAVKRALLSEGLAPSTGLPVNGSPRPTTLQAEKLARRVWHMYFANDVSVTLVAEARTRPSRSIPARDLAEGMVLVTDVHDKAGTLLARGGTRLTTTSAADLAGSLASEPVDVAPTDDA